MGTKKKTKEDVGSTQLGDLLQKRLAEMDSNMMRMSEEIGHAYDYCRRICKGLNHPSPKILKKICDYTELDYDEMLQLVQTDKAFDKAVDSGLFEMISGDDDDPTLLTIRKKWKLLTEYDKLDILDQVSLKVSRAIKHTPSRSHATV